MRKVLLLLCVFALSFTLFPSGRTDGGTAAVEKAESSGSLYLGSKVPYPEPVGAVYTQPPEGYEAEFIYWLNRHGSRNLSGFKYDKSWLDMIALAESEGALSEAGYTVKKDIERIAAYEKGKYGLLTLLGKNELYMIGQRTGVLYKDLFAEGRPLFADATYKERTCESRDSFLTGLMTTGYQGDISVVQNEKKKDPYLRSLDIAGKYDEYKENGDWYEDIIAFTETDEARAINKRVISQFFTPEFVDRLDKGEFEFYSEDDDVIINSLATATNALWEMYIILPALKDDGFADVDMSGYFKEEELVLFEKVQNAKSFYTKGPGRVNEEPISLEIMAPLAKRMINEVDAYLAGETDYTGVFSFAHAETVVPLVGFLEIEDSAVPSDDISEAIEYWDVAYYGPMAANLEWIVYTADGKKPLVKVLLNEKETSFAETIKPVSGHYYNWSDVKAYYGKKVEDLGFGLDTTLEENIETLKADY